MREWYAAKRRRVIQMDQPGRRVQVHDFHAKLRVKRVSNHEQIAALQAEDIFVDLADIKEIAESGPGILTALKLRSAVKSIVRPTHLFSPCRVESNLARMLWDSPHRPSCGGQRGPGMAPK